MKNIMVDNIERVLERGEKIELLVDKTDNLRFQVGSCWEIDKSQLANTFMLTTWFCMAPHACPDSLQHRPQRSTQHTNRNSIALLELA